MVLETHIRSVRLGRALPSTQLAAALTQAVKSTIDQDAYGYDGRLNDWRHCLVDGYDANAHQSIAGMMDVGRLRVPESGIALAMNSFFQWRERPHQLPIAGETGFTDLRFDARCPTGVRGTPPHLDLIAARGNRLVAVTSRGCDFLARRQTRLAAAYDMVNLPAALKPWGRLVDMSREDRGRFMHLDPGSLMKFALGLGRTFTGYALKLVYLYNEPQDASEFVAFQRHRGELEMVREIVSESAVTFHPIIAQSLWQDWYNAYGDPQLRGFVAQLRQRYNVAIRPQLGL